MKITGIVAEYNPFHNGHAYQIKAARENGATHIVCVMSGNFTQRGDAAIADKWARARCALENGADLVIELPVAYALGSAPIFAKGSIETLLATGCMDAVHFGSECGDIKKLNDTAYAIQEMESRHLVDTKNNTVAAARTVALREHGYEQEATILESPNNLLGVEYILQLKKRYSHTKCETICRAGVGHDSTQTAGEFCSASQLRLMLAKHPDTAKDFLPQTTLDILTKREQEGQAPISLKRLDTALLSRLRMMEPAYLSRIAGVSEGLENRLYEAIRQSGSFDEICTAVKTKRYPLSRIRRILLCAAIGITEKDEALSPQYIRILGQNEKGQEVLRIMGQTAKLPVLMRASHFENLSPEGKRLFRLENLATDLYTMAYTPMGKCGSEYTMNLYKDIKGKK
jgi:predicted nucleotidyltransferase